MPEASWPEAVQLPVLIRRADVRQGWQHAARCRAVVVVAPRGGVPGAVVQRGRPARAWAAGLGPW
eukprot:4479814-Heterocapsa_arctica.AAC.1